MKKTNEQKRFTLRMDVDTFEEISKRAEKNKRAIGSEIEIAIEKYLEELEEKEESVNNEGFQEKQDA